MCVFALEGAIGVCDEVSPAAAFSVSAANRSFGSFSGVARVLGRVVPFFELTAIHTYVLIFAPVAHRVNVAIRASTFGEVVSNNTKWGGRPEGNQGGQKGRSVRTPAIFF